MNFGNNKSRSTDPTKLKVVLRNKAAEEAEKFTESLKNQILGEKKPQKPEMSMVDDIITQGGKLNPILSKSQEESITAVDKKRLAEIEAEMKQIRMQRERKEDDYVQNVQAQMDATKKPDDEAPVQLPSGVNRRARTPGAGGRGKSKGSGEMLKSKK